MKLSAKNFVDSVRRDMIVDMKIFFPSFPEQTRIASFLTSVDQKLTQLKQKKTLLEQYKKGVMQKIFNASELGLEGLQDDRMNMNKNNEILQSVNPRNPNPDRLRFKDENGKEFPKWETKKLGEVAELYKGKGLPKSDLKENGKYKCLHYGELFTKYNELIKEIRSTTDLYDNPFLSISNDVLMPISYLL